MSHRNKPNKTYRAQSYINIFYRSIILLFFITLLGCDDSEDASPADRFRAAEELSSRWCLDAQIAIAGLEGTEFGEDKIEQQNQNAPSDLTEAKAFIDPESEQPIKIISYLEQMTNSVEEKAPSEISKQAICKMKSQEGIERGMNTVIEGNEGTCRAINEAALKWALEQLSADERSKYETEGAKLLFSDDLLAQTGADWYGLATEFANSGNTYNVSSSSLLVSYDENPDMPESLRGVHYCKLITPTQVLFWLLHRAFWADPIGTGPNDDADAALITDDECQPKMVGTTGSCIFYFPASNQHYCEEYTGSEWTAKTARERCIQREEAEYSSVQCKDRTDETSIIDGDGEFKGTCVINCGDPGEYQWLVYSIPESMPLDEACAMDWFPA